MRKLIFTLLLISSSFLLKAQVTVFTEDFENPPGNVTSSGTPGWFTCNRIQAGGLQCDSSAIVNVGDVSYLETTDFDCSFNFFVTLTFQSIAKIEFFDNATIEVSIDGGGSWVKLVDDQGGSSNNCVYMGTGLFRTQGSRFQEASYATWQPGVLAVPDNSWWKTETFDISAIAGGSPQVRLRFVNTDFNNSGGANRTGWYVDDISVVASFCELIAPSVNCLAPNYPATVYNLGPFPVNVSATDVSGVGTVTLNYSVNGVAQTAITMTNPGGDSIYTGMIPAVDTFDVVCYNVTIVDGSFCQNVAYCPGPGPNDSICFSVEGGVTFPYCDNFDLVTNLWTVSTPAPGTDWELGVPNFGATNSAHSAPWAWDVNLNTAYTNGANTFLQSPEFSFVPVGAGATLEFWQNRNSENGWDGTRLEWTTDTVNGPWNVLGSVGCLDCVNWYTDDAVNCSNLPAWEGNSGGWVKSSIILDAQFNNLPQVWFRFPFCSDASVIYDGFTIDDFCISLPQPEDVGVTQILMPGPTGPALNCVNISVTVKNYGLNTQNSFPVTYVMTPPAPYPVMTQTETYTGTLTPGATATFTFVACDTIYPGISTICAWTSLPGDQNNFNDTSCTSTLGIPVNQLTACDDFENGNLGFQTTTTNAAAAEWQLGTPAFGATTGAYSGTNAWDINLVNGYGVGTTAVLTTAIYDLSGAINPYLSFRRNQLTAANDGLRVYYDFNGSGTFTLLGTVNDPDAFNWYNNAALNFGAPGWDGSSNGWMESRYYLQNLINLFPANSFVQFQFEFISGFNGAPNDGVSIDDLCVKQPGPNDIGVVAVTVPGPNGPAGNLTDITASLRNFGSVAQPAFPVFWEVDSAGVIYASGSATYNGNLLPAVPQIFTIANAFTVPSGSYGLCVWTELPGDTDNSNDTTCIGSVGIPVIALSYTNPYVDNFDVTNVGWSQISANPSTIWEWGAPAWGQTNTAHSAPWAWDVNLNSAYGNNADCDLYTPIFDLTNAVDAKLSFWRNHNTEQNWDGVRLEYTVDGGITWTMLGGPNLTAPCWVNWYNMPTINCSNQPAWAGTTGGWVKTEATCLSQFDSVANLQFRFHFCSDASVQVDGFSIDDFRLDIPVPLTAAPITINTNTINTSFIFPGQSIQFTSPISNPGTTPLTSVNATITIAPIVGGVVQPAIVTVTDPIAYSPALASQANLPHIFSQLWTAAPGTYQVCVITSEPNNGLDQNPFDDTTCITISVFDSVSITAANPYCTDFESGPQWVAVNAITYNSTQNAWEIGTPTQTIINSAYSGTNAWTIDLDANYANRDTSGLFSPVFSIDNSKFYKLSFRHKYDTEPFADGGTVEYSTDYAQTWQHLGFASSQPQPWFNTPFITALGGSPGLPGWSGLESNWVLAEQCAQFYNGGTVIFRFRFASDNTVNNYEGWAIDDVCFEEVGTCVVGINDPESNGVMLGQNYPNPFNGTSSIEYVLPGSGHVKISITNVIGQEIAVPVNGDKAAGSHSVTINSRELGSGIYYYTLEFDGKQITRKMIITE